MQLTTMSSDFKVWLFILAVGGFLISLIAERQIFPSLARILGRVYFRLRPNYSKQRRQYKILLEEMQ